MSLPSAVFTSAARMPLSVQVVKRDVLGPHSSSAVHINAKDGRVATAAEVAVGASHNVLPDREVPQQEALAVGGCTARPPLEVQDVVLRQVELKDA